MVKRLSQADIEENPREKEGSSCGAGSGCRGATLGCTESGAQAFADKRGGREVAEEGWREGAAG